MNDFEFRAQGIPFDLDATLRDCLADHQREHDQRMMEQELQDRIDRENGDIGITSSGEMTPEWVAYYREHIPELYAIWKKRQGDNDENLSASSDLDSDHL